MPSDNISTSNISEGDLLKDLEVQNTVLSENGNDIQALTRRSQINIALGNFKDARIDAEKLINDLGNEDSETFITLGQAQFSLGEYGKAAQTFKLGKDKCKNTANFDVWIEKCDNKLTKDSCDSPKIKQDWYQTDSDVVVSIMLKNLQKDQVKLAISSNQIDFSAVSPANESLILRMNLAHDVNAERSSWKVLSSKVEIKLKKIDGIRWSTLHKTESSETDAKSAAESKPAAKTATYPSSSLFARNWDQIAKDIEKEDADEKLEGDAAVNQLFQKIYSDGNEEVRRAMNKSFMESGGTVLSTNWSEVGEKKVDVKPPDGMEYKKWES